jgi:fatty acid desaturase
MTAGSNAVPIGAIAAVNVAGWLAAPLLAPAAAPLALAAMVAATLPHWGLVHEAMHGHLAPQARRNRRLGRLLAVVLLLPFEPVRFGHLMHHRHNRHPRDTPEVATGALAFYAALLGGFYLAEILAPVIVFLPGRARRATIARIWRGEDAEIVAIRLAALHAFRGGRRLRRTRLDFAASLGLVAIGFWAYAAAWPALAVALALRGLVMSLADNMAHYGTTRESAPDGLSFATPCWVSPLLLGHNYHRTHHRRPDLPWQRLAAAFAASGDRHDAPYLAAALRQLKGPLGMR